MVILNFSAMSDNEIILKLTVGYLKKSNEIYVSVPIWS